MSSNKPHVVVVVGPEIRERGGIASVLRTWAEAGLIGPDVDSPGLFYASTVDGPFLRKVLGDLRRLLVFARRHALPGARIHIHVSTRGSFWRKATYAFVTFIRGGRYVLHVHPMMVMDAYQSAGPIVRAFMRQAILRATRIVAVSTGLAGRLAALPGCPPVQVVLNPIPDRMIRRDVAGIRHSEELAFLGWFVRSKGIVELLDAFGRLRADRPGLRLVLAGHKNERWLRGQLELRGLAESVDYLGWISTESAEQVMRSCTMLVLPSHTEGMPMVVLEAMACGTPIVTCPVGAIPEFLQDGVSAAFVRPGDVEHLIHAISKLLDDEDLRRVLGEGARNAVEPFRLSRVAESVRSLWLSLGQS